MTFRGFQLHNVLFGRGDARPTFITKGTRRNPPQAVGYQILVGPSVTGIEYPPLS